MSNRAARRTAISPQVLLNVVGRCAQKGFAHAGTRMRIKVGRCFAQHFTVDRNIGGGDRLDAAQRLDCGQTKASSTAGQATTAALAYRIRISHGGTPER